MAVLVVAGTAREEKWSNVEAAEFYRRGLEAAASVPSLGRDDLAGVWEGYGDVLQLSGEFDEASRAFAAARRLRSKDRRNW